LSREVTALAEPTLTDVLAAALALKDRLAGQRVALMVTGGNISIPKLKAVLDGGRFGRSTRWPQI
jgi:threonine dehydratase